MPRRPPWRLSDPSRPGDRLVFAALSCYRVSIIRGRYTHQYEAGGLVDHLGRRMDERDLDLADVLGAVAGGRICTFKPRGRDWIGGGFLLGGVMVYCQAFIPPGSGDFSDAIPSICSAWRLDPDAQRRPLTAPVCELLA